MTLLDEIDEYLEVSEVAEYCDTGNALELLRHARSRIAELLYTLDELSGPDLDLDYPATRDKRSQ